MGQDICAKKYQKTDNYFEITELNCYIGTQHHETVQLVPGTEMSGMTGVRYSLLLSAALIRSF